MATDVRPTPSEVSAIAEANELVWALWQPIAEGPRPWSTPAADRVAVDVEFHGPPIGSLDGRTAVIDEFWNRLGRSFPVAHRQAHLFLGGVHQARIADGPTAAFTGWPSLQGTFDGEPFRGIAPTGGPIGQNLMDFYVRRGDKLQENWVLIDLVDVAAQRGVDLLAPLADR
ncbi:MAG: ester cyclase [Actinomycetota bacterium]